MQSSKASPEQASANRSPASASPQDCWRPRQSSEFSLTHHYLTRLSQCDRTLACHPNCATAWYGRGDALANLQRYPKALESFERAIELDPTNPAAWTFKAVVLFHLERYDEALASCDQALCLAPDDREAWTFRGAVLNRLGRFQEAYHCYDRALNVRRPPFKERFRMAMKQLGRMFRMDGWIPNFHQ